MTRKLYYDDSHIREFDATVTECAEADGFYEIVLDKTAFFPEGGGNPADVGTLGAVNVRHTFLRGDEVAHRCDGALEVGASVHGRIDWDRRFSNMQNHTAEHIVSGLVHRRRGYANVGFHMGADGVVVDFDGFLDDMELSDIEREANEAVWRDVPVTARFPAPEELAKLEYRSKLELKENVRLVTIEGVDVCACCAPHVGRTGEIGSIKIFERFRRKNGVRIRMLAGDRAYEDYVNKSDSVSRVSALLSAKPDQVTGAVERLLAERDALSYALGGFKRRMIEAKVSALDKTDGDAVFFEPDFDMKELQLLCDAAAEKRVVAAAFSGDEESGYKYAMASRSVDLRARAKEMNAALDGRGGGKPQMVSGTVKAGREEIEMYWGIGEERRDKT